jgi:hypothetical protein
MAYILKRWGFKPSFQFLVWVDEGESLLMTFAGAQITTFSLQYLVRF